MAKVLVFDFGASSGRAILVETDGEKLTTEEIHRFPNNPITVDGTLYWDIDTLFEEVKTAALKADKYGFDAISVDTWGVDFAILDKDGNFVEKPVHYRDKRTEAVIDEVDDLFGGDRRLYMKTGIMPQWFNTIYQLYALKKARPESLSPENKLLMMPDLICHYLTGEFKNEYAEATTTSLLNPETKQWDKGILDTLGISPDLFCPIVNTGEIYGFLKSDFTRRRMRIPVIAVPSHDTAAAIAAVPAREDEFLFISTGTWALLGTELKEPVVNRRTFEASLTNEGGHSGTTTLLKNIMGMWLFQELKRSLEMREGREFTYNDLETYARQCPPTTQSFINPNAPIFAQPCTEGDDMFDRVKRFVETIWGGITVDIANEKRVIRCVYDSLAAEFRHTIEKIEMITDKSYSKIYMFGGGTKDKLLCQLVATATGKTVIAGPTEATAIGNALCAFVGLGEIGSVKEAREIVIKAGLTREYNP